MLWTADLDRRLLDDPDLPAPALAAKLTEEVGVAFTVDQVDKRRRRLRNAMSAMDAVKDLPEVPAAPAVPQGEFVGLRVLFTDLETTDLGASWGHLICASFGDEWGNVDTYRIDDPRFKGDDPTDDGHLAAAIRDRWNAADLVCGHNVRLFDRPFLNARLMKAGHTPLSQSLKYIDTLYMSGGQNLRLGSRKLDNIARFFALPHQKTPLDGATWQRAAAGVGEAIDLVVTHCESDVLVLRDTFALLRPFLSVVHR